MKLIPIIGRFLRVFFVFGLGIFLVIIFFIPRVIHSWWLRNIAERVDDWLQNLSPPFGELKRNLWPLIKFMGFWIRTGDKKEYHRRIQKYDWKYDNQ